MTFFSSSPKSAKAGFRVMLKYFEINKRVSLLYLTNRFHVAVRLFRRPGESAFQVAAPHLWNELPLQLRTLDL